MKRKRLIILIIGLLLSLLVVIGIVIKNRVQRQVKELFKMNKALQEEGYYMADFEFRMLGFAYYLDKGYYIKALTNLSDYHAQLSIKDRLIKIPKFKNNQEEINFYLNLQNPKTGAFIDESAPFCTYWSISENIILHLDALTDSSTMPLKLKYPLKFLDEISTPEKLVTYLNDISYVGWLAPKLPQTSFHLARDIFNVTNSHKILEKHNLYQFSPEWKHTLLKWMYEFQDSTTGLWGPKYKKSEKIAKYDLHNASLILKIFRDNDGNNIYDEFPLKYQDRLFETALVELSKPIPGDYNLEETHEWNLQQCKGIQLLLRYIWKDASVKSKKKAEEIINKYVEVSFEKYFVENDGAFSYYPYAKHASLDGSSVLIFEDLGAYSYKKQKKLWGDPQANTKDLGVLTINEIKTSSFDSITNIPNINSLRIYLKRPKFENLTENVYAVFYPKATPVLDVMELVPRMLRWADSVSLSMGNWVTMEEVKNEFSSLSIKKPLIFKNKIPLEEVNKKFEETTELYIIGFDKLQIPRFKIEYKYLNHNFKSHDNSGSVVRH